MLGKWTQDIWGRKAGSKKIKKRMEPLIISPSELMFIDKLVISVEIYYLDLGVTIWTWRIQPSDIGGRGVA